MSDVTPAPRGNRPAGIGWAMAVAGATLLAAVGCTGEQPAVESVGRAAVPAAVPAASPAVLPGDLSATARDEAWRLPGDFRPPFEQRQELFVPPDRSVAVKTARQVGNAQLALKGFADFEGRRVLLELDGSVVCLREGQQQHGITVVAIQPPQVTLRHQGREWTETLLRASLSAAEVH